MENHSSGNCAFPQNLGNEVNTRSGNVNPEIENRNRKAIESITFWWTKGLMKAWFQLEIKRLYLPVLQKVPAALY